MRFIDNMKIVSLFSMAIMLSAILVSMFACIPESTRQASAPSSQAAVNPQNSIAVENSTNERQAGEPPSAQTNDSRPITEGSNIDLQELIHSDPADVDNSRLPITPIEEIHTTGNPQSIDIAQYRLSIDGLVDQPLSLDYGALMSYRKVTETVLLICPGLFVDNAAWTGIPVATLLETAGIKPEAQKITFIGKDGYRQTLSIEEAQQAGVFLAYMVNGKTLPTEHGFPLRLIAKGHYGNIWVKWLVRIEVN